MCFYIIYHYIYSFQTNTGFPKTSTLIIDNMENISSLLFGNVFLAALSTDQLYISKCKMGFPNVDVICFVCKTHYFTNNAKRTLITKFQLFSQLFHIFSCFLVCSFNLLQLKAIQSRCTKW